MVEIVNLRQARKARARSEKEAQASQNRALFGRTKAEKLKAAIPGCSHIAWSGPSTLDLAITVNLGVVKPTFKGELALSNVVPAQSYTLSGRGKGGLMGMAEGAADITLADDGAATLLAFTAQGGASGQVMKLGKAIVDSSAQRIIDGFFERFAAAMGAEIEPQGTA